MKEPTTSVKSIGTITLSHEAIQCNIRNIAGRKKSEARIIELAFFDQLTGLRNRILLLDRLKQAVRSAASR